MRKHHKRTVHSGGATPDGKIPFPLMTKWERFIRCRGQRHGSRGSIFIRYKGQRHGSRGSMILNRGMVPGGAYLSDAKDRDMVPGGA
jgi:hypothetical protein